MPNHLPTERELMGVRLEMLFINCEYLHRTKELLSTLPELNHHFRNTLRTVTISILFYLHLKTENRWHWVLKLFIGLTNKMKYHNNYTT